MLTLISRRKRDVLSNLPAKLITQESSQLVLSLSFNFSLASQEYVSIYNLA